MGILWENSLAGFIVVVILVGGGAAYMTGRAIARGWQTIPLLVFYCFLLACVSRFLQYALYEGTLLSPYHLLVSFVILFSVGLGGFRIERTRQMVTQYRWEFRKAGPFNWVARQD